MIYPKVGLSLEKLNLIALFNFLLENKVTEDITYGTN